jgi:small GTP-binding protein
MTAPLQKKICLLGSFAVGKTSLVRRYVHATFSDKYLTTLGVKVDSKELRVGDRDVKLMVWDLAGEDEFQSVRSQYVRGAAGVFYVVDGTRPATATVVLELKHRIDTELGPLPFILLQNKADLRDEWELDAARLDSLGMSDWERMETSAATGAGVEAAFARLAGKMVEG